MELLVDTFRIYRKYPTMIVFFSIIFLLSLAVQLFAPVPIFIAFGGHFLRTGSLPEITILEAIVIFVISTISLFLLSLALAVITLVVKATKTRTKISTEIIENIGYYSLAIFAIFFGAKVIGTLVIIFSLQSGIDETLAIVVSLFLSLGLFYVAPAVVLEEKKPIQAFIASYQHIIRKPLLFIFWLVLAFVLLSIFTSLIYALVHEAVIRQVIVALINSLFVVPILIILQAEIYLKKYTIIER